MAYIGNNNQLLNVTLHQVEASGIREINANGTYDVKNYASVSINVPVRATDDGEGNVTIFAPEGGITV